MLRNGRGQHIGVRDRFQKRHLGQMVDAVDLPAHGLFGFALHAERVSVDDLRQSVELRAQDGAVACERMRLIHGDKVVVLSQKLEA